MSLNHDHTGRNLAITVILNSVITVAQFIGGIISGSLGLISDAIHNLSDVVSVILAFFAHRIGQRKSTLKSTYGFKRAEILAAFINAISLVVISVYLFFEAIKRFLNPEHVDYKWMIILGFIGLLANSLSVFILHHDKEKSLNIKAAYLHLIGDALTSLAVITGGFFIMIFDVYWIDPLVTVLISIYIFVHTFKILKQSTRILMQFAPKGIGTDEVATLLSEIKEISDVHHIHIWQLDDNEFHFEAHIVLESNISIDAANEIIIKAKRLLNSRFGISHTTFQFEHLKCTDSDC